jgi:hypothetical protein
LTQINTWQFQRGAPAIETQKKLPFDPKVFPSKANGERSNFDYRKDQIDGHFRSWPILLQKSVAGFFGQ